MPHLHLNISHNLKFRPDFLLGLTVAPYDWASGAEVSLQEFSARSCTRLAGPYLLDDPAENVFRDLSGHGASHCNAPIGLWETLPGVRCCLQTNCAHLARKVVMLKLCTRFAARQGNL